MDAIRELPVDVKIHILRRVPISKLVFLNKLFYYKYHEQYILSKYNKCFEDDGAFKYSLLAPLKQHFDPAFTQDKILVTNNFNFSKKMVKIITESIKYNYVFLLSSLFADVGMVIYKIDSYILEKPRCSKWMNMKTKDGCAITRHKSLYSYMKCLCDLYNVSVDIKEIIDDYYFNYFMKLDDCERTPEIPLNISPLLFGYEASRHEDDGTLDINAHNSHLKRRRTKLRREKKKHLKENQIVSKVLKTNYWGIV